MRMGMLYQIKYRYWRLKINHKIMRYNMLKKFRKQKTSHRKLSSHPQNVNANSWYYEKWNGLLIIHEVIYRGKYLQTDSILIPNRVLLKSFRRMFSDSIEKGLSCLKKNGR